MNDYRILHGDALTQLRTLPDRCVHCIVTSPPYYGLRERRGYSRNYPNITGAGNTMATPVIATTGWRPTCACPGLDGDAPWPDLAMHPDGEANWPAVPCTVLDPFLGSGTTIAVAVGLGRHGIGIELNRNYIRLAERRICNTQRPLL